MKPLHLLASLSLAALPAQAAETELPLPQLYRATLPCLVHVYRVPVGDELTDPLKAFLGKSALPSKAAASAALETGREAPYGMGLLWGDGSWVLTAEFVVPNDKRQRPALREFVLESTDGHRVEAKLQAIDRPSGVALLKTEAPVGPACRFGTSAALEVGQPVAAIGNVRGLRLLLSQGHVSGLRGADIDNTLDADPVILTSTVSGPGMAGGPLLDLQGRVIGMHQSMLTRGGGFEGVAVALPIDRVLGAATELARQGKVTRSRLGLQVEDERLPAGKAALLQTRRVPIISSILPGSPAERAGLRVGDRLIAFESGGLSDSADLRRRVSAIRPGTGVRLEFERDGTRRSVTLTPEALGDD